MSFNNSVLNASKLVRSVNESTEKSSDIKDSEESINTESTPTQIYHGFDSNTENQIQQLARQFTHQSSISKTNTNNDSTHNNKNDLNLIKTLSSMSHQYDAPGISTFNADNIDERLDPNSSNFNSRYWVQNLRRFTDKEPDYYKPMTLGVAWKNLKSFGIVSGADYQTTVGNGIFKYIDKAIHLLPGTSLKTYFDILKPMDGIVYPGEILAVLGRPGAGCSTFLKSIAGHTYGYHIDKNSIISYDGISQDEIRNHFRGEVIYNAETESHFPHLTVWETLNTAAKLKTPQNRIPGISRDAYAKHMTDVYLAMYGLSSVKDTKSGDEYIRGISGGERKRLSITEASLCGAPFQLWDNSTRGLDSANAVEFTKCLRTQADILNYTTFVSIYQCSDEVYSLYDKVCLLYEGHQIYFGSTDKAKRFFLQMGFLCPQRQTAADFLTSLTNPNQRIIKKGYENKVPRTPKEFETYWKSSEEYKELIEEVDDYVERQSGDSTDAVEFKEGHYARQSKISRKASSYTVSFWMQVKYILIRDFQRIRNNFSYTAVSIFGNVLMALLIGSIFYDLPYDTGSFYYRCSALFVALLFNAFSSLLEILSLYEARPIVEKHKKYSLYHPAADAMASILSELPTKLLQALVFNIPFYFMVHFRRTAGAFFFFFFTAFLSTICMSHLFRCIGAATKTLYESMSPASILLLALTVYMGFVIPTDYMLGWSRWINYINPLGYTFESFMANEFHNVKFDCSQYVPAGPSYTDIGSENVVCNAVGSVTGVDYVLGDDYLRLAFKYYNSHKWRNIGIILGYIIFFLALYIILCEFNEGAKQKGEVLLFQRKALKNLKKQKMLDVVPDIETGNTNERVIYDESESSDDLKMKIDSGSKVFHWKNVCYDIQIKGKTRRILNNVSGWVKPGTVTALMGASGAGKTTLLDVLANRVTMGIVHGDMFVNGHLRDKSFQRLTGYVQQQDLHLTSSTVREALRFSAYLRQPYNIPKEEKDEYVENVIKTLEMQKYADSVVGVTGEGLNVEQRKRLSIGVELVAKPELLLFLDEPTSGLDSETAWSICRLIRKLADQGQAILCTIHQPSALLLDRFDRLLLLKPGGQTVYFGDLGDRCQTLINYFEKYGDKKCPATANPAEWMLDVIGSAPGSHVDKDYSEVWLDSSEYLEVLKELEYMEKELVKIDKLESLNMQEEFAAPLWYQYKIVLRRIFEQLWRTPLYIWSKILLTAATQLFNGFSFFKANNSQQGLQNQILSVFMNTILFTTLSFQMFDSFVSQREIYEIRERPSKTFSWKVFIGAIVTAEVPYSIICGTIGFFCWYYPLGLYRNAEYTDTVAERGVLVWLFLITFFLWSIGFGQAILAGIDRKETAGIFSNLLFTICMVFNGVMVTKDKMPGFWIFMYRVSPLTYWVQGVMATGVANAPVVCNGVEMLKFKPTSGLTCSEYMESYMEAVGGYLRDENSTEECFYCIMSNTNSYLSTVDCKYDERWRNFGIFCVYVFFNFFLTVFFYWMFRVPKSNDRVVKEKDDKEGKRTTSNEET
ncbi:pleiotropic drug resistance family ABC transporter [Ascoidea rubescens DSM 1968]|uniref:Drug resistance protein 1 n=1 Tax=Ascoidea rubescens DSM 1968 TaxID=1344418 RepID=A0A1D2VAQ5_9ASCO|nr:drug resistance protein 1 [Ascoidea rubescens DSM 1968]ODV58732.1 drug resistance protein 1 [Ascoidea rubescens DSM 1968]